MKSLERETWYIFYLTIFSVVLVMLLSWVIASFANELYPEKGEVEYNISLKEYEKALLEGNQKDITAPMASALTSNTKLMVGGTSLGIIMKTDGVLVVGYSSINDEKGAVVYPAKDSGIALGDSILSIEGEPVHSDDSMLDLINAFGDRGELAFKIRHGEEIKEKNVKSYFCEETNRYRVGLYVRDNMGGVGTLTFFDPNSERFGALGHPIEGAIHQDDTGILGRALPSAVRGIKKATKGATGEKIGYFESGEFNGTVDTVGSFGIYGTMDGTVSNPLNTYVYPAKNDEVQPGAAKIVTVVEGSTPEFFDIEILKVDADDKKGKGLTIEITDKSLIKKTGGIVQGMSGSPILQNGKLVGAVTYVMVNQPRKGYGCLISYMIEESNVE